MFGIECYVSNHEGFSGLLKKHPEDFAVTEISPDGRLATISNQGDGIDLSSQLGIKETQCKKNSIAAARVEHPSVPINEESVITGKEVESTSNTSVSENKQTERKEQNSSVNHKEQLASVLDDATLGKLDAFAADVHENLEGESKPLKILNNEDKSAVILDSISTLNLGLVPSKDSRTVIHKSIRYLYPHLRTINHKLLDQNGLEVHVSVEPVIKQFQELHIRLGQILPFIKFVESRAFEETFSFEDLQCKEQRTKLHRLVAKHYGSLVETKTFGDRGASSQEQQRVVVRFRQKFKDHKKRRRDGGAGQISNVQSFTGFTLQKTNTETLAAIEQLARVVGVHISDISYAGIKDKKAVTTQHMAVKGVTTKRFLTAVQSSLLPSLRVGNVHSRHNGPILLGQLWGNHFDIKLRHVGLRAASCGMEAEEEKDCGRMLEETVQKSIDCVQEAGFINYYGEQRFGAASLDPSRALTTITPADIGCAMLQRKYTEAVKLILSPDDGPMADSSSLSNVAKQHFQDTGSAKQVLKLMPSDKTRECLLLKALNRHGGDEEGCIKAMLNLPHSMRQMYIHAFCSLMWNQLASWRMHNHGYRVLEGDLVQAGADSEVTTVTKGDVTKSTFSIKDVVLPLPGNRIQYPSGPAGDEYRRRLEERGLGECNFRLPALKLNIPGDYRKLLAFPRNLTWELSGEFPITAECISGENNLQNKQTLLNPSISECTDAKTPNAIGSSPLSDALGYPIGHGDASDYSSSKSITPRDLSGTNNETQILPSERTLNLSFDLPSSCYATMFLHELMKT